jgi:hypothetical protein
VDKIAVFVIYDRAIDEEVLAALRECGIESYTRWHNATGVGTTGHHQGDQAWPALNNVLMAVTGSQEQADLSCAPCGLPFTGLRAGGARAGHDLMRISRPRALSAPALPAAAMLLFLALGGCGLPVQKHSALAMTSPLNVLVAGRARPDWEALMAYTDREASLFDWRLPDSPVGRLNAGQTLVPPAEVASALAVALEVASASGGAFDPTVLPLVRLWSFDTGGRLPPAEDIRRARSRVDWRQVRPDGEGRYRLPEGFALDLGGIAQGAVVDLLGAWLEQGFRRPGKASGDIWSPGKGPGALERGHPPPAPQPGCRHPEAGPAGPGWPWSPPGTTSGLRLGGGAITSGPDQAAAWAWSH